MIPPVAFRSVELSDPAHEQEGLRFATVKSRALGRRASCTLWSPRETTSSEPIGTLLILLHGVYGSEWVWPLKAGVHRTAARLLQQRTISPLALAMPSDSLFGDGSAYLEHADFDAERWIVDEVPAVARLAIPALAREVRIAIAGLSMGGYGALRLGAKYPERFSAISAHSAITQIAGLQSFVEETPATYTSGSAMEELDPLHWLTRHRDQLPPLRFDCGIQDSLLQGNRDLHAALISAGIAHRYEELPGAHDWHYWSKHVEKTLRFVSPPKQQRNALEDVIDLV